MPISTDSDVWTDSDTDSTIHERILDFLSENPEKAFHYRELCDAVQGTDWAKKHKEKREMQRVGEDEFYDRLEEGEYPEFEDNEGVAGSMMKVIDSDKTITVADHLVEEGYLEKRSVPVEETDIPYDDWETVMCYTYNGSVD